MAGSMLKTMLKTIDRNIRNKSILGETLFLPSIFKTREEYVTFEHGKYLRLENGMVAL